MKKNINMKTRVQIALVVCMCGLFPTVQSGFAQGSLTPTGAPGPTMKTLTQVEPRTPVATNTTPGDASDLFVITNSGSYYLTTNIAGASGKSGIEISANNDTLDLNGFALQGVASSVVGIYIPAAQTNITVRNGTLSGWADAGVYSSNVNSLNLVLERLSVDGNDYETQEGIFVQGAGVVRDCNSCNNGESGIYLGSGIVSGCKADGNALDGINTGNDVLITGCTVTGNGGYGIATGVVCKVADCIVANNMFGGIVTSDNSQITGCHVNGNSLGGISITSFSLVRDNMVDYQQQTTSTPGICASDSRNRVEANNITRCGIGLQVTSSQISSFATASAAARVWLTALRRATVWG